MLSIYITDAKINPAPWELFGQLPRSATILIRDYDHPQRPEYAARIVKEASRHGFRVMVAGNLALARRVGAGGLHLPEWQLKHTPTRLFLKKGFQVTAAAHALPAVIRANHYPYMEAVFISPVFETGSHPGARPLGPVRFAALARACRHPVIALGGLKTAKMRRLQGAGIGGIAMVSSWLGQR